MRGISSFIGEVNDLRREVKELKALKTKPIAVVYVDCSGGLVQDTTVVQGEAEVVVIDWDVFDSDFVDKYTLEEIEDIQGQINRLPPGYKRNSVQAEYDEAVQKTHDWGWWDRHEAK